MVVDSIVVAVLRLWRCGCCDCGFWDETTIVKRQSHKRISKHSRVTPLTTMRCPRGTYEFETYVENSYGSFFNLNSKTQDAISLKGMMAIQDHTTRTHFQLLQEQLWSQKTKDIEDGELLEMIIVTSELDVYMCFFDKSRGQTVKRILV